MSKRTTMRQQLKKLPPLYREMAMDNIKRHNPRIDLHWRSDSLTHVILMDVRWTDFDEDFWKGIFDNCRFLDL